MIIPAGIKVPELRYHLIVIAIYILVCGYFFFFKSSPSSYFSFQKKDLLLFFSLAACSLVTLFLANKVLHFGTIGLNPESPISIILTLFYSLMFAVPEEIIFRGIIEKNLESFSHSIFIVVLLSAAIFGAAHLLNGALGLWPPSQWDWQFAGITFVAGAYLAFAYIKTDSLVIPIALHMLFIIVNQVFILKA